MFDLEKALAAWRRSLTYNRAFTADDLDELEQHVRDQVAEMVAQGLSEEAAFSRAMREMGDYGTAEMEYRKVYWGKVKQRGELLRELTWRGAMLRNYLKIALRNFKRHKGLAAINVFGLAVAVAAATILGIFVAYERSFDQFHTHAERIYALVEESTRDSGEVNIYRFTRTPALPALLREIPEVERGTRVQPWGTPTFGYGDHRVKLDLVWVDSMFFDVFSASVLVGDARAALSRSDAVILTESAAARLFGEVDPVGKLLDYSYGEGAFTVEAVVEDPPPNSTLQYEVLGSFLNIDDVFSPERLGGWYNSNMPTYLLVREGADHETLAAKLQAFKERHYTPYPNTTVRLLLQPFTAIHAEEAGRGPLLAALTLLAAIILLIACINFTNLATAQALARAREIGMRKVLGAQRQQLAAQFLGESVLTCGLALVLGIGLTALVLPLFNRLFDLPLELSPWEYVPFLLGLWLALGVLAGIYPAFYLSGLGPIRSLRGRLTHSTHGQRLRRGLVVVQFSLSVFLMAGTLIVWQQIQYMKTQDVRFDRENVIVLPVETAPLGGREAAHAKLDAVREELLAHPVVRAVSFSEVVPGRYGSSYNTFSVNGDEARNLRLRQATVDARYFETYGIDLVAGAGFSSNAATENESRVLLNEAAARRIGEGVFQTRLHSGGGSRTYDVAGIVADFHYHSFAHAIEPMIHYYGGEQPGYYNYLSVRIMPGKAADGVALLQQTWQRLYGSLAFSYFFIDEAFDALYRTQERLGIIAAIFALLAVLIASLGLLALATFSIQARTKEIGVRKVLGATVRQIVTLLSKDLAWLVVLASVLATPVGYFIMHRWLDEFAYHIEISWQIFLLAGLAALVIALLTVSYQAIRAAFADPVKSLRYE